MFSYEKPILIQPKYCLSERNIEKEIFSVARNESIGVISELVSIINQNNSLNWPLFSGWY